MQESLYSDMWTILTLQMLIFYVMRRENIQKKTVRWTCFVVFSWVLFALVTCPVIETGTIIFIFHITFLLVGVIIIDAFSRMSFKLLQSISGAPSNRE